MEILLLIMVLENSVLNAQQPKRGGNYGLNFSPQGVRRLETS